MEFLVLFPDGRSFGPADVPTLASWASEGRLLQDTTLENVATRERVQAGQVAGIFSQPMSPLEGGNPFNQQPAGYPRYDARWTPAYNPPASGMSIASLVLGILSLVTFCFWPVAGICGLLGLIFGILALRGNGRSLAWGGIVCSVIGLVATIGIIVAAYYFRDQIMNWR